MDKEKEKETFYFSHDSNASEDPNILKMRSIYGWLGYGWYWMLVEMMRNQKDFKLNLDGKYTYNAFAMKMQCTEEQAEQYIQDCINEFKLFKFEDGYFWSESLLRRMAKKEEKKQKRIEAAKRGAEKRWLDAIGKQPQSDATTKDGKEKETKGNKKKEKLFPEDSIELQAAEAMFRLIRGINPNFKEPKLQKWAEDFDKILRIDKRNPQELQAIMIWIYQDSFWKTVILSPAKLREQYDTVNTKRLASSAPKPTTFQDPPH